MTNNPFMLKFPATCPDCGFTSSDVGLLNHPSCHIHQNGGRCEDYPCCGHEAGDCNGLLYGSDQAIQADPHLSCDHEAGDCEVEDYEAMVAEDDDTHDEVAFTGSDY